MAGQYLLSGISHIFKLRIIADMEDRVQKEMHRENINAENVRYILMKDDDERRKWGLQIYGIDMWDFRLYDMVLHIGMLTIDDAVDIICSAVQKKGFQETPESRKIIENMYLAVTVQSDIIGILPTAMAEADDGVVNIIVPNAYSVLTAKISRQITSAAKKEVNLITPKPQKNMINPFHNIN